MIKVHCFVSCVCEVIKKTEGVDHRPYYFGVWDADFDITENGTLTYHSEQINHDFFKTWYELLYGIKVNRWYSDEKTKEENVDEMLRLLKSKPKNRHMMVMLDLSKLPERENKFHQSPFPHYVMLEESVNPDEWFMFDPDFRWEGKLPKERILSAISEPAVKGGFYFDSDELTPTTDETIEAYFHICMKHDKNPMTDAVSYIIDLYTSGREKNRLSELGEALKQLPVLSIRKYAYEHAFAYFREQMGLEEDWFEGWCDEIELLVKGYTTIQYRAMKLAMTGDLAILPEIVQKITEQDQLEFKIKKGLTSCFNEWVASKKTSALA